MDICRLMALEQNFSEFTIKAAIVLSINCRRYLPSALSPLASLGTVSPHLVEIVVAVIPTSGDMGHATCLEGTHTS